MIDIQEYNRQFLKQGFIRLWAKEWRAWHSAVGQYVSVWMCCIYGWQGAKRQRIAARQNAK